MWIVAFFDMEEADQDQSVLGVYGPFEDGEKAEEWANEKWIALGEEQQEFRGMEVLDIEPIEKYEQR